MKVGTRLFVMIEHPLKFSEHEATEIWDLDFIHGVTKDSIAMAIGGLSASEICTQYSNKRKQNNLLTEGFNFHKELAVALAYIYYYIYLGICINQENLMMKMKYRISLLRKTLKIKIISKNQMKKQKEVEMISPIGR